MLPIIPALVLAFISFICSVFVILRIVIPILPPHPLSKRVSPAEFGLPTFRKLSPADKSHLWLAGLDLVALVVFIWQGVTEYALGSSTVGLATDPGAAVRLWIVVTIRQTCLLMVAFLTLLHVRMANSVSFGSKHWMLLTPTALLVITSTTIAGILSGTGMDTLFYGLTAYSSTIAILSTIAFACLIRTLFTIKKNLTSINEPTDAWPPVREVEDRPRPSFGTEDMDAIRDGASWLTSEPGSRRQSISGWSFSTHHTTHTTTSSHHGRPQTAQHPSVPSKSSFWFASNTAGDIQVPPVPPLPSPYGPALTPEGLPDPDPFRREVPKQNHGMKTRMGSQSSWLTSSDGSHTTLTAWSFPGSQHHGSAVPPSSATEFQTAFSKSATHQDIQTTLNGGSRPVTPALSSAQVLGGYGYAPGSGPEAEKGMTSLGSLDGNTIEISMLPAIGWSVMIWLPMSFALPYLIVLAQHNVPSLAVQILFILSVTLSSPLLTLNLLVGSPLPIPVGLFDGNADSQMANQLPLGGSFPPTRWSHDYKRSTSCSVTVVESRRSGDVWISKGDAVDGKGKFSRAMSLLNPAPKLSVLPPAEGDDVDDLPPIPFQHEDSLPVHVHGTPQSENSVQFGRMKTQSKASSQMSHPVADESLAFGSRIMVAQRHYSAMAQTVVVPAGTGNRESAGANTLVGATGVASKRGSYASHVRTRSGASTYTQERPQTPLDRETACISPPPSIPLPPTPPNVRAARLAMLNHKKSFSSGYSIKENHDDINEIDAMTAGVLPLLVPGLKVGDGMKIKDGEYSPPGTWSKHKGMKMAKKMSEFGEDFSSPEVHSTPARTKQPRNRKVSGHKKNHFSLPSLSLGKEGMQSLASWGTEIRHAFETKVTQYTVVPSQIDIRRNTVLGVEGSDEPVSNLSDVQEDEVKDFISYKGANLGRTTSLRSLGLKADVPHNIDSGRSSLISGVPPSANSEMTLFDDFEAGLESGPQAESTPHNSIAQKPVSRHPPPPMPNIRRSSIRYIKAEERESIVIAPMDEPSLNTSDTAPHWSTRTRSVVPKASKLNRSPSDGKENGGLRQLTLLQDRGNVANVSNGRSSPTANIRPLTLGKKQKSRMRPSSQDENAVPGITPAPGKKSKNLKELTLVRSETSKARAVLRKTEVLPDVVVRPPSLTENQSFVYNFHG
ncbi:hypothetical protein CPB83DRAFT_831204 [Crepidotus variabilis]|uniref:Uncharacterized protein n=1 Tax=Crepidotus variabilis TaxID=179855 RepID=A0A9P6EUE2_9AGAR|nr:hypothetical protein CPB83DRAFT_831204 [Crepidotus variabilis]